MDINQKKQVDQLALTIIAPIDSVKRKLLETLIKTINQDVEHNPVLPFSKLQGVHFCRFVILPGFKEVPDQLAYSVNFDGALEDHLHDITSVPIINGFVSLFSCCVNYPSKATSKENIAAFIQQNKKKVHTFYRGYRGFSVSMIHKEYAIYSLIQNFLNENDLSHLSNKELKEQIKAHVSIHHPDLKVPDIKLPFLSKLSFVLLFLILPLLTFLFVSFLIGILLYVVIVLVSSALYLRHLEKTASEISEDDIDKYNDLTQNLSSIEDLQIQNQLTHMVELRHGVFRRMLQGLILVILNNLVIYTHNRGSLGSITSIHFARWQMIDHGRRLIFFSNYDGNWESYIGDFIDRNADGLTLAWSNTHEFPRTRWLVHDGATNEEYFKVWIRKNQVKTDIWYSAYKTLTVKNVIRNHKIALGLNHANSESEITEWLKLL